MTSQVKDTVEAYRGLACYRDCDEDRKLFFGRTQEKQDLLSLVLSSPLALLFSRSGLGKTSLLNAGLLQPLRERVFFPVMVRLTNDRIGGPVQSVYACLREAAKLQRVTPSAPEGAGTLWEYFYDGSFTGQAETKQRRVVLIFDQFEELFTVVARDPRQGRAWEEAFIRELADLVRRRVPEAVQQKMAHLLETASPDHPLWERAMTLVYKGAAPDVKVVLSMREEFLPNLQALKPYIPGIFDSAMRLEPLSLEQAREAIVSPGQQTEVLGENTFGVEPDVVEAILGFCRLAKAGGRWVPGETIEPVQLQILCQHLDERRRRRKANAITLRSLGGRRRIPMVIEGYYRKLLRKLPRLRPLWSARGWYRPSPRNLILLNRPRAAAGVLCEKGLVTPTGDRNSLAGSVIARKYGVPDGDLEVLTQERLIQSESRLGSQFYELSHDTLARAVRRVLWRRRGMYLAGSVVAVLLAVAYQKGSQYLEARPLLARVEDASLQPDDRREALQSLSRLRYTRGVQLHGAKLSGIQLIDADFSKADLSQVDFTRAYCHHCIFVDAVLEGSDLSGARLAEADLQRAKLRGAKLVGADLTGANLRGADLRDADVEKADFAGAKFEGTGFAGTAWWLAYGWRPRQIDSVGVRWPAAMIEGTTLFNDSLVRMTEEIDQAGKDLESAALSLNNRAWFRAIRGVQLDSARRDVTRALKLLDTLAGLRAGSARFYRPHFLDTRGFILLQQGQSDSAAVDFKAALTNLVKQSVEGQEPLEGQASYRLGLALCRLGKTADARARFRAADSLAYRPSYELLLVPKTPECASASKSTRR